MKTQKGAVLLVTMVVLSMLSLVGLASLSAVIQSEKSNFAYNMHEISKQIADNAIVTAMSDLKNNDININNSADWSYNKTGDDSNGGTYSYTITKTNFQDIYQVSATGTMLEKFSATNNVIVKYVPGEKEKNANNGWGNGDQDAPGNSGDNNNAENNTDCKSAPKGIQKKYKNYESSCDDDDDDDHKSKDDDDRQQIVQILSYF